MPFTNLKDKLPEKQGMYTIQIKGNTGALREAAAVYSERGFSPVGDHLIEGEFIIGWE